MKDRLITCQISKCLVRYGKLTKENRRIAMLRIFALGLVLHFVACQKSEPTPDAAVDAHMVDAAKPDAAPGDPMITYFAALPYSIKMGDSSLLSWSAEHVPICSLKGPGIDPLYHDFNPTGTLLVFPPVTAEYILTCFCLCGGNGVTKSLTVEVK